MSGLHTSPERVSLARADSGWWFGKKEKHSLPPLVNFPEKHGEMITKMLGKITPDGRLLIGISRIEYVDFDPNGTASASYLGTYDEDGERVIRIYGPLTGSAVEHNRLLLILIHEVSHHAFDPTSHERDAELGETGYNKIGIELFGSEKNANRAKLIMWHLGVQAIMLNEYANMYQQGLGHAYLAVEGLIDELGPRTTMHRENANELFEKISAGTATDEEKAEYQKLENKASEMEIELRELIKKRDRLFYLVMVEGLAIMAQMALTNPKNLKEQSDAREKKWKTGGYGKDLNHQPGYDMRFMSLIEGVEEILMMVYKTDKYGLNKIRAGIKSLIIPVTAEAVQADDNR